MTRIRIYKKSDLVVGETYIVQSPRYYGHSTWTVPSQAPVTVVALKADRPGHVLVSHPRSAMFPKDIVRSTVHYKHFLHLFDDAAQERWAYRIVIAAIDRKRQLALARRIKRIQAQAEAAGLKANAITPVGGGVKITLTSRQYGALCKKLAAARPGKLVDEDHPPVLKSKNS